MQVKLATALFSLICIMNTISAKELGSFGQTYDILESDFLQLIETRYQHMKINGEWARKQQEWQQQMMRAADRPHAINTVGTTKINRTYYVDPSIKLSRDIVNTDGTIIAHAGTVVNPLAILPLHKTVLFINADDAKQIEWAIKKNKLLDNKTKLILVKGSIKGTVAKVKTAVYFDQGGRLTKHFKIQHVPAMLQQDALLLKIEECVP